MSGDRDPRVFLADMLDAGEKAIAFVEGMDFQAFVADEKTVYAVVRCFEIIGEAAKRVPPSIRGNYPALPWRLMAGMRDRLIHNYLDVNHAVLWATLNEDLPSLISELRSITGDAESIS